MCMIELQLDPSLIVICSGIEHFVDMALYESMGLSSRGRTQEQHDLTF